MHCVLQLIYPAMPLVVVVRDVLAVWYFLKAFSPQYQLVTVTEPRPKHSRPFVEKCSLGLVHAGAHCCIYTYIRIHTTCSSSSTALMHRCNHGPTADMGASKLVNAATVLVDTCHPTVPCPLHPFQTVQHHCCHKVERCGCMCVSLHAFRPVKTCVGTAG